MGATGTYVRAGLPEVATALSALTGERHPLAPQGSGSEHCPPALTAGQTVKHSGERICPLVTVPVLSSTTVFTAREDSTAW